MRNVFVYGLVFWVSMMVAVPEVYAATQKVKVDDCLFQVSTIYGGSVELTTDGAPPVATYSFMSRSAGRHAVDEVSIRFTCNTNEGRQAFNDLGFDSQGGKWVLLRNEDDPEDLARVQLYVLNGNGADGAAVTDNQTTGEESERTQGLSFCLTDHKQILCGTSSAIGYVAYPKQSNLPKVLKLLESIEFLDPASP
ncbi:hypothetical protein ACLUTX_23510 [Enterobacterales bacterium AE_CKDN230030158-1A_HGKHYDSX7]